MAFPTGNPLVNLAYFLSLFLIIVPIDATPVNHQCENARYVAQPNVFVLTDMSNEPDDQMSLVRLLTYANEIDIHGIAATTLTWLRNRTDETTIRAVIDGYAQVVDNLNANVPDYAAYPPAQDLLDKVTSAHPVYGLKAFDYPTSDPALALLDAARTVTEEHPLWVTVWGGAAVLAEALRHESETAGEAAAAALVKKLRVYSISDQDDAGIWIRLHYPKLFYIVSLHGFSEYSQATWNGISGEVLRRFDEGGPDTSLVTNDWLEINIRKGPLGAHYPNATYIMEGDTPSFFPLIQNGLGDSEHPEWGSWGGRYILEDFSGQTNVYSNTADLALGLNNKTFLSKEATIWRWRQAYQYDFAARMNWTVEPDYAKTNHHPVAVVNGSCGLGAQSYSFPPNGIVYLDASASWDADGDDLVFHWFHYRDPTQRIEGLNPPAVSEDVIIEKVNDAGSIVAVTPLLNETYHIILTVLDDRDKPLLAYRRLILESVI